MAWAGGDLAKASTNGAGDGTDPTNSTGVIAGRRPAFGRGTPKRDASLPCCKFITFNNALRLPTVWL